MASSSLGPKRAAVGGSGGGIPHVALYLPANLYRLPWQRADQGPCGPRSGSPSAAAGVAGALHRHRGADHPAAGRVLPAGPGDQIEEGRHALEVASGIIAIAGIALAALLFLGERRLATSIANSAQGRLLSTLWFNAWGFDWLYDQLWVKPYLLATRLLARDPLDWMMGLPAWIALRGNQLLAWTVTGKLRWYAASMGIGAVLVLALLLLG